MGLTRRASVRSILAAVLATAGVIAAFAVADPAGAATTIHVAPDGDDRGSGSADAPLASLEEAVRRAVDGDAIEIRSGTYHESVQIFEKRVHVRGVGPTAPVFDGARRVDGFVASGGDWFHAGWDVEFQINAGPMVEADQPEAGHPDQMFLDGVPLRQVLRRSDVRSGTFFHDTAADRLWIGDDPTGRLVEASALSFAIYLNRANGSSLSNVTVQRYATEFRHQAAIRAYADDLTLTNVTADSNAFMGLSIIGDDVIVEDGSFIGNGYIGVHGDRLSNVVVRRNAIARNNTEGFSDHHSASGLKFTRATSILLEHNESAKNAGPGLWTDIDSSGITMIGNLVTDNDRSGMQIELTANVTVVDNVAIGNGEAGIWVLESQNVNIWHNAVLDNRHEIYLLEGTPRRRHPGHAAQQPARRCVPVAVPDPDGQRLDPPAAGIGDAGLLGSQLLLASISFGGELCLVVGPLARALGREHDARPAGLDRVGGPLVHRPRRRPDPGAVQ